MPSATQESSMQDLTSRMGYNMHYYESATSQVIFSYTKNKTEGSPKIISIPKRTILINDINDITYITTDNTSIDVSNNSGSSGSVGIIEGKLKKLKSFR